MAKEDTDEDEEEDEEAGVRSLAGIRLDSGDLAYLSLEARKMFREVSA